MTCEYCRHCHPERSKKQYKGLVLTKRQREVISHVEQGMTNKEIANILCISEKTVKFHMASIYKIAPEMVNSRPKLVRYLLSLTTGE